MELDAEELGCGDNEIEINLKTDVFGSGGLPEEVESGEKDEIEFDEELTGSGYKGTTIIYPPTVSGSGDTEKQTDSEQSISEEVGSSEQETIIPTTNNIKQKIKDDEVELGKKF